MSRFTSTPPRGVQLGGQGKRRKRSSALSPRIAPPLRSNSAEVGFTGDTGRALLGVTADFADTARVRRPRTDTNASRKHGGTSVFYRRPAEEFARESLLETAGPSPVRPAPQKADPKGHAQTLANAESEGIRQRAMMHRSALVTSGAIAVGRAGPVWLEP